ncbi:ATP-binding protein [Mycobacterium intracellulare]|uniref:AAA family ATPase n=1 Tax=Mycobacterium intracellulare subsp. chimaera TaxID=222805 RepID=A0A220Y021_MYCIT|nr:LuxR family transcriptional regulator [Mycobacterium intracellulare]ASL11047.1 regulatory protein LuxR [Mycobacterium intracellulare subsp. chimaera]ASL16940.1 regulatory protein LuxR [Mycobacterium intracellulare subsp. chimaera]ASL22987.1 regulatory protein LuxR [Mycobacterium intracellulare subsp. chimaera]MCA2312083.1 AAA family ATPase [Mycobacterium intracellulare subsp. chimaera]MCA2354129.1 AAA family ATPase [Mycobacterium intracellulare subsp. chimaera]
MGETIELIGRRAECLALDELVEAVCAGESRALVIHGEAGIGKSALLDYLAGRASSCRVMRAAGVQSEMELAFAALHQLCGPTLERLDRVPMPQRDALRTAFGVIAGPPPDRFLIGLAVLSLLSETADERPVICLVDDEQWLDKASAQVLAFVARRLVAESVGIVFAARVPGRDLAALPHLAVRGLPDAEARALLDVVLNGPLDARVRDQIVAETHGNPLALVELPRGLTAEQLAGGFGLPSAAHVYGTIEESFRRRIGDLPQPTRDLLLVAAAEPTGDPALIWAAAAELDIRGDAAAPAIDAGVVEFGARIWFQHPLARSAAYQSASLLQRQQAHRAIAHVTDPLSDPDRRAWHLAQSAAQPDEDIAAELLQSAGRARARGGVAAAAAFLERATALTVDPVRRAQRGLDAAAAKVEAGAFDAALDLIGQAEAGALDDGGHARLDLVRAQLAFVTNRGSDAPPLLVKAAKRLESIDLPLSRATYLEAMSAAMFAARLAGDCGVADVARAARSPELATASSLAELLLDGFVTRFTDGYAAGVPVLRRAVDAALTSPAEQTRWLWLAGIAALDLWDDESWALLSANHVRIARTAGALTELPLALSTRAIMLQFAGELTEAETLVQELQTVTEATGAGLAPYGALMLAAYRGEQTEVAALTDATARDVTRRGEGVGLTVAERAVAVLSNGIGDYKTALAAAKRAVEHPADLGASPFACVEMIEAAVRCGSSDDALETLDQLTEMTRATGTDWALGIEARSRALLSDTGEAEELYRAAIERLGATRMRTELARAHLLYGEWLRRQRRRIDARVQLRTAHSMLDAMGMEAFAERAGRELRATGETARKRSAAATGKHLTAQEVQIARLARDGLSNPEIGARLFISARTVQYHLRKVFTKLDIRSRSQLDRVL